MNIAQMRETSFDALGHTDVMSLLTAAGGAQEELFRWAREVRGEEALDEVLLRGVIEISNICQKSCDYCAMRATNRELARYALEADQILDTAHAIKLAGIGVVMLQGGQHPRHEELLEAVIPTIRHELGMRVLLCMGERQPEIYQKYHHLGADSYIVKFETSDAALYEAMTRSPYERRLSNVRWARAAGLKIGTGNMVGLPDQSAGSLVQDIHLAMKLRPDFISSAPFIPNPNTPFEGRAPGSVDMTLNTLAVYRIALRRPLIPSVSALETLKPGGQLLGLLAGANVITINFTPHRSQSLYRIYSDRRFVVSLEHALRTIERAGLRPRSLKSTIDRQGPKQQAPVRARVPQ